eukprot:3330798-Heterocapsa_arctica.AAC.1
MNKWEATPPPERLSPSSDEIEKKTAEYFRSAGIEQHAQARNRDAFFIWALTNAKIQPKSYLGQCVCRALANLKQDKAGHLAYILSMYVVQSFDQTVQDHTIETSTGNSTTAGDKSKWSTTVWEHDINVKIAIADEKGNGNIYFVTPHTEWGRSASLLPDGTLERPPPEYYENGRTIVVYPTFTEGQVLAIVIPSCLAADINFIWYAEVKETHDPNTKRNTLELISNKPLPPPNGLDEQLAGTTRTYIWSQILSLPNSVPAGR